MFTQTLCNIMHAASSYVQPATEHILPWATMYDDGDGISRVAVAQEPKSIADRFIACVCQFTQTHTNHNNQ